MVSGLKPLFHFMSLQLVLQCVKDQLAASMMARTSDIRTNMSICLWLSFTVQRHIKYCRLVTVCTVHSLLHPGEKLSIQRDTTTAETVIKSQHGLNTLRIQRSKSLKDQLTFHLNHMNQCKSKVALALSSIWKANTMLWFESITQIKYYNHSFRS